jgi:hypothetical protein
MFRKLGIVMIVATITAGCLQKETTHTLYLSPDGAVTWAAMEVGVRSDERDDMKRIAEEQAFRAAALDGSHAVARGLMALNPSGAVGTRVLRDERPFQVLTEARFGRLDGLLQRLFDEAGLTASAQIVREGRLSTLHIRFDFAAEPSPRESPVDALAESIDTLRVVLTSGEFVSTKGFVITGAHAVLSKEWMEGAQAACDAGGTAELSLTWDHAAR